MTSLINSYINKYSNLHTINPQKELQKNTTNQDSLRTNIKAYKPKGHILKTNIFNIKDSFQSDINSLKYFFNGIQGKGTDYSVGKINDVALKLGGLGIATIIASGKGSTYQKGMEFVGFGAWFLAMSLWPKLAINAPIKFLKGVDLNAQYVTAKGDRKNFYQDPQFLCWDMVSDEQIHKMGDKLGVPRDIQNRRQAIEKKAKQVAIQGNTLALLTAGFATPLIASITADKVGKLFVKPGINKLNIANVQNLNSPKDFVLNDKLKAVIESIDRNVNEQTISNVKTQFSKVMPNGIFQGNVDDAIDKIFESSKTANSTLILDEQFSNEIINEIMTRWTLKPTQQNRLQEIIINHNNNFGGKIVEERLKQSYLKSLVNKLLDNRIVRQNTVNLSKYNDTETAIGTIIKNRSSEFTISSANLKSKLFKLAKIISTYDSKISTEYMNGYFLKQWVGETSNNAKVWEIAPRQMLQAINPNNNLLEELINASSDKKSVEIMSKIIDDFVNSNDAIYKKSMDKLVAIASDITAKQDAELRKVLSYLDDVGKLLTSYKGDPELAEISKVLSSVIANKRAVIFGKILSRNNTIYSPIRTISLLRDLKKNNRTDLDYNVLKSILLKEQTVDAFITKFEHLQRPIIDSSGNIKGYEMAIKNQADYIKYMDYMFSLPDSFKQQYPKLFEQIEKSNMLLKVILGSQFDGVNDKFSRPTAEEVIKAFNDNKLAKYLEDFMVVSCNNKDDLFNSMIEVLSNNKSKYQNIKKMLILEKNEIQELDAIFDASSQMTSSQIERLKQILARHLYGDMSSRGYLDNAKGKVAQLLEFFGSENLDSLKSHFIAKAHTGISNACTPKPMTQYFKDNAKELLTYNKWFKRVGISFLALCGLTAIGIACIGRKNEFNKDIYTKKVGV